MYIEEINIEEIGKYEEINVKFNKGVNIIVGPNGSGKTTLLSAIILAYNQTYLSTYPFNYNSSIEVKFISNTKKYHFGFGKGSIDWKYGNVHQKNIKLENINQREGYTLIENTFSNFKQVSFIPLVFGINRSSRISFSSTLERKFSEIKYYYDQAYSNLYSSSEYNFKK
ncbi:AAA family ATPase [Candidatus Lokiarchaeum ossiferum]|uniref:AAA family ATPase n=1 Tax=Candidatus Lokiarchaeum ossiferum TaxID=2951803 RepID=UPI00352F0796